MAFDLNKAIQAEKFAMPQKDYLWRLQLPSLQTPPEAIDSMPQSALQRLSERTSGNSFDTEILSARIVNVQVPFFEISTDSQHYANSFWYYATTNDIGEITLEIEEHEDGQTFEYFNAWKNLIINENGTYNPPIYYKRELRYFKVANVQLDLGMHKYKGYFVSNISDLSNSYDSNDIMRYSVTLTGDDMEYEKVGNLGDAMTEQQKILNDNDIQSASLLERFTGLDGNQQRSIFNKVIGSVF